MPPVLRKRKVQVVVDSDSEPEGPPPKKRLATRGRRAASGQPARAPGKKVATTQKKPRKARKGLQNMLEMPLDVVYEILAYLHPADLVHLRKINGVFHEFLSSPSAQPCWSTARANWEADGVELPPRPEDMTEVDFLDYLFGKYCHRCSKSLGSVSLCWEVRRRFCGICRKAIATSFNANHTKSYETIQDVIPKDIVDGYPYWGIPQIREVLPVVHTEPLESHKAICSVFPYLEEDLVALQTKVTELKGDEIEKYLDNASVKLSSRRLNEIPVLHEWFISRKRARADVLRTTKNGRLDDIVKRLEGLGWGDELNSMDDFAMARLKALPVVKQPKPLTERMWKNAQLILVEFMEEAKVDRIRAHRKEIMVSRLTSFIGAIAKMLLYKPGVPSPADIALGLPKVREIVEQPVEVEVNEASFESIRDLLPDFVAKWKQDVKTFFSSLVRSSVILPANMDALSLAIGAFFICECGETRKSYQTASWHQCQKRRLEKKETTDLFEESFASTALVDLRVWQPKGFSAATERVQQVVKLFGLDDTQATPEDMDVCDLRLACKTCDESSSLPKPRMSVLTWRFIASGHHKLNGNCELYLVSQEQAAVTKQLEAAAIKNCERTWEERQSGWGCTVTFKCARCPEYPSDPWIRASKDVVFDHIKQQHDIENPVLDEDAWINIPGDYNSDEWVFMAKFTVTLLPPVLPQFSYIDQGAISSGTAVLYDFDKDCAVVSKRTSST